MTDHTEATSAVEAEIAKVAQVDRSEVYEEDSAFVYYTVYTTENQVYSASYNKSTGAVNVSGPY